MVKDYPGLVGKDPKAKDADPEGSSAIYREMVEAAIKNPVETTPGTEAAKP